MSCFRPYFRNLLYGPNDKTSRHPIFHHLLIMELDHIGRRYVPNQLSCTSGKDPENRGESIYELCMDGE
jgi:hypothetical protein